MTMLCTLIRGQMSYTFFSVGGHMFFYVNCLGGGGGQMSSYAIFHKGAHVRGGGGGCPTHSYAKVHDPIYPLHYLKP